MLHGHDESDDAFRVRLLDLIQEKFGGNVSACARAARMSVSGLNRYRAGGEPTRKVLISLAKAFSVQLEWLITGQGAKEAVEPPASGAMDDFALVPLYDVWAAAGTGAEIEQERVLAEMAFRRYWLAKLGLHAEHLVCIRARGDSMSPTILDGDILLVDRQRTTVDRDSIYIVRSDDGLRVKRLQRLMGGGVRVSSDNRAYAEEVVSVERLVVVGQVVWKGGAI